jgi:hypothetical protein
MKAEVNRARKGSVALAVFYAIVVVVVVVVVVSSS